MCLHFLLIYKVGGPQIFFYKISATEKVGNRWPKRFPNRTFDDNHGWSELLDGTTASRTKAAKFLKPVRRPSGSTTRCRAFFDSGNVFQDTCDSVDIVKFRDRFHTRGDTVLSLLLFIFLNCFFFFYCYCFRRRPTRLTTHPLQCG